jgi:hypothetical protein
MPTSASGDSVEAAVEKALVRAFVVPTKQARVAELLGKSKRRGRALHEFADPELLDSRFIISIPPSEQCASEISRLLQQRGATSECYVLSEMAELDGKRGQLLDVLDQIVGLGVVSLVSCLPGQLGYYEGEARGLRYLLHRRTA